MFDPLQCNACKEKLKFKNISGAKIHRATVHKDHPYACPDCGYVFKTEAAYSTHYQAEHISGAESSSSHTKENNEIKSCAKLGKLCVGTREQATAPKLGSAGQDQDQGCSAHLLFVPSPSINPSLLSQPELNELLIL